MQSLMKLYFLQIIQHILNNRKYKPTELNDDSQEDHMLRVSDLLYPEVEPKAESISAEQQAMCTRLTSEVSNFSV